MLARDMVEVKMWKNKKTDKKNIGARDMVEVKMWKLKLTKQKE